MGFPIPRFLLMTLVLYGSTSFFLLFWSSLTFSTSLSSVFSFPPCFFFAMLSIEPQHCGQEHGKHSTYAGETIIEYAERATNI